MPSSQPASASTSPSVANTRRTSRARAPTQRRMPISRVRSSTLIVTAETSPTMPIATIRKPSTVIVVDIWRLPATLSRSPMYVTSVPIS